MFELLPLSSFREIIVIDLQLAIYDYKIVILVMWSNG